jgi:hypothetical protein
MIAPNPLDFVISAFKTGLRISKFLSHFFRGQQAKPAEAPHDGDFE